MIKKIWKDPVWSKVIASCIITISGICGIYVLGAWPSIKAWLKHFWGFILSSSNIPHWLLASMIILSLITVFALIYEIKSRIVASESQPTFESYINDCFFDLLWGWHYFGNQIHGVHCLCPKCKYEILPKRAGGYAAANSYSYACENCGYSPGIIKSDLPELEQKVKLKIQQKLRTGDWIESLNT